MYRTLSIENLAYRCWELRGRRCEGAPHDWGEAERLRRQLVEEAAYFRWLDRGERLWDSWRDWFAAEAEVVYTQEAHPYITGAFVDERLRRQLVEEAAYFRWLDRGERLWDSWRDWFAAEAEVLSGNR